jgi:hypothetical protein
MQVSRGIARSREPSCGSAGDTCCAFAGQSRVYPRVASWGLGKFGRENLRREERRSSAGSPMRLFKWPLGRPLPVGRAAQLCGRRAHEYHN